MIRRLWLLGGIALPCALVAIAGLELYRERSGKSSADLRRGQSSQPIAALIRASDPADAAAARAIKASPPTSAETPGASSSDLTLGTDQREYLWQVEHHGLILIRDGFSRFAQALRRNDTSAFNALMASGFEGSILDEPRETRTEDSSVKVLRQQDSGKAPLRLDRACFSARLFEDRARFSSSPQVKLALMALAPIDRSKLDGLWEGTCQLRMWGEMGPGRPGEVLLYLKYRLPKPSEENLKQDAWLHSCFITQRQVSQSPHVLMREVAAERGVRTVQLHDNWKKSSKLETVSGGVYLCDFNRDGCLDLMLIDVNGNFIYEGQPDGKMVDVTSKIGLPQSRVLVGAAIVDLDNDGWEDMILGSSMYRNEEGKRFQARPVVSGPALSAFSSAIVADYDRDGLVDLYVTSLGQMKVASWVGGEGKSASGNTLWHNDGNWHFTNVTEASGASGGDRSTFSAVWLDANEDGWPDIYVINEFGSGALLVNQGDGKFRDQTDSGSLGDFGSMGISCGDYDNDGHIDLYVANMYSKAGNRVIGNLWPGTYPDSILARLRSLTLGSQIHHNRGGMKFERLGNQLQVADVGWAYGPAMVDLNNDGWLDLFGTCGFISQSRDDPDG
jgi:hypothetical protein